MATHSSILAWRIPWTEEPGGIRSMGSQRVGHDWATEHVHTLLIYNCCVGFRCTTKWFRDTYTYVVCVLLQPEVGENQEEAGVFRLSMQQWRTAMWPWAHTGLQPGDRGWLSAGARPWAVTLSSGTPHLWVSYYGRYFLMCYVKADLLGIITISF